MERAAPNSSDITMNGEVEYYVWDQKYFFMALVIVSVCIMVVGIVVWGRRYYRRYIDCVIPQSQQNSADIGPFMTIEMKSLEDNEGVRDSSKENEKEALVNKQTETNEEEERTETV